LWILAGGIDYAGEANGKDVKGRADLNALEESIEIE